MNKQLKPCPFCGSCNIGSSYIVTYSVDSSYDVFGCKDCGARFENGDADEWNTRAEDAAIAAKDARIAELVEENDRLRARIANELCPRIPATPSEDGREVPTPIARAFITGESGNGEYRVVMKFETLAEMQAAHNYLVRAQPARRVGEVITEHGGCGRGVQVDQLTVRLYPGDKVLMVRGPLGLAMTRSSEK